MMSRAKKHRNRPITDPDWFETSVQDSFPSHFTPKRLKLLADAQLPGSVVEELRSAGITIKQLAVSERHIADSGVLSLAQKSGRVLLTLDDDFWNDRVYPLHTLRSGIIVVAEPPDKHLRVLKAFGLVYGCFAKSFPLDWWGRMKVRATVREFELKVHTWQGRTSRYKMRLRRGRVVAKELDVADA